MPFSLRKINHHPLSAAHWLQPFLQLSNAITPLFLSPSSPLLKFTSSLFSVCAISAFPLHFCFYITIFMIPSLLTTSLFHSRTPPPLLFPCHKVSTVFPAAHLTVVGNGGGALEWQLRGGLRWQRGFCADWNSPSGAFTCLLLWGVLWYLWMGKKEKRKGAEIKNRWRSETADGKPAPPL